MARAAQVCAVAGMKKSKTRRFGRIEGLYVLDTDTGPQVRRLTARIKGGVLVICDNNTYSPETISREQLKEITLGKVVALGIVEDRRRLERRSC